MDFVGSSYNQLQSKRGKQDFDYSKRVNFDQC